MTSLNYESMATPSEVTKSSRNRILKSLAYGSIPCLLLVSFFVSTNFTQRYSNGIILLRTTNENHTLDTSTNQTLEPISSPHSNSQSNWNISEDIFNSTSPAFLEGLKRMGIEPAEVHAFKSPLIFTPHVYADYGNTVKRVPGIRKTKVISIHKGSHATKWFAKTRTYNIDFKQCPYSECEVDVEGRKEHSADLILFICRGFNKPPTKRLRGQLWALGCWESDAFWDFPKKDYDRVWKNAFNLTFSYRMDSDVFSVYRKLAWRHPSRLVMSENDYLKIAKAKTKTATWWAGHCKKDRLEFVKEMQKYIDIDIYGGCGTKKCPKSEEKKCLKLLNTTYKFYLSFENSFCKSYVTEKVIKLFHIEARSHTIPVVMGGLDYDQHFPPFTIVNGNNFPNAKELALHLKGLGSDVYRYARMLQEKDRLVSPTLSMPDWCDVCQMLHTNKSFGFYRDIRNNWSHHTCATKSGYRIT